MGHRRERRMMGRRENGHGQFFYLFDLDEVVPPDHLKRLKVENAEIIDSRDTMIPNEMGVAGRRCWKQREPG
jgi:hypothetical protein